MILLYVSCVNCINDKFPLPRKVCLILDWLNAVLVQMFNVPICLVLPQKKKNSRLIPLKRLDVFVKQYEFNYFEMKEAHDTASPSFH